MNIEELRNRFSRTVPDSDINSEERFLTFVMFVDFTQQLNARIPEGEEKVRMMGQLVHAMLMADAAIVRKGTM